MCFWVSRVSGSEVNGLSDKSTLSSQLTQIQVLTQLLTHPIRDLSELANLSEAISLSGK